jgi:hypothetical protein
MTDTLDPQMAAAIAKFEELGRGLGAPQSLADARRIALAQRRWFDGYPPPPARRRRRRRSIPQPRASIRSATTRYGWPRAAKKPAHDTLSRCARGSRTASWASRGRSTRRVPCCRMRPNS